MSFKSIKSLAIIGALSMAFTAPALADTAINIVVNTPAVVKLTPAKTTHRHVVSKGHTHVQKVVVAPVKTVVVTKAVPQKVVRKRVVVRDATPITHSPKVHVQHVVYTR
ncbi:hypothetical protein [Hirschia litorea]|uniref:Uncharacterized protein n=1 Tax=Hirschia litorea TaxID=1199156 RepID=A0ABW2IKQ4_9PROT